MEWLTTRTVTKEKKKMADRPPSIYCSKFEIGTTYTMSVDRRGTYEKNGSKYLQLSWNPANLDGLFQGTLWFDPPGHERHRANEWVLLDAVAPIGDAQAFTAVRKGTPWYWTVNGVSLQLQDTQQVLPPSPQTVTVQPTAPVAPQRPSGAYSGPWLKDAQLLFRDCVDVVDAWNGEYPAEVRGAWATSLFISLDRAGAAREYARYRPLHLIGSKPADGSESEDGLSF